MTRDQIPHQHFHCSLGLFESPLVAEEALFQLEMTELSEDDRRRFDVRDRTVLKNCAHRQISQCQTGSIQAHVVWNNFSL